MRRHPFIYEISTWVWLDALSRREGTLVTLADVPGREWDAVAQLGFDAVWLMGVWERSPAGVAIALENEDLLESFRRALPDFVTQDVVGSPYCIRDYRVDAHLGGPEGLAAARAALAERGLGPDPGLRAQPRRSRPSVDGPGIRSISSAAATTTSTAIRVRSCASAAASWPTVAIRTSRRGRTSFS